MYGSRGLLKPPQAEEAERRLAELRGSHFRLEKDLSDKENALGSLKTQIQLLKAAAADHGASERQSEAVRQSLLEARSANKALEARVTKTDLIQADLNNVKTRLLEEVAQRSAASRDAEVLRMRSKEQQNELDSLSEK